MNRILFAIAFVMMSGFGRQTDPWVPAQLLEPVELAAEINHPPVHPPLVVSVGPSAVIKGSPRPTGSIMGIL
jgi:hypothetical protein